MARKIKVLSECRKLLRLMNLCVKTENRFCGQNIPHLVIFIALSTPLCYSVVMHMWEAFNIGMNLKEVSTIILTIVGTAQVQLIYFGLQVENQNILRIVEHIQQVVDRRCNSSENAAEIYEAIEQKNSALAKSVRRIGICVYLFFIVPSALSPVFYTIFQSPTPDKWQLPLHYKMFHRIDTYLGYYAGFFENIPIVTFYTSYFFIFNLFFVELCIYADALTDDLRSIADSEMNAVAVAQSQTMDPKKLWQFNSTFFKHLTDFVELHNDFCEYLINIRTIMTGPLFCTLSSCIVYLAIEFLALDETFRQKEFDTTIAVTGNALLIAIVMVYNLSFYSEKLTTHSYEVADFVYTDLLWYLLTGTQQKRLVLPICRAQKCFRLVGYGIFYCSMETFLKIIHTSISYFVIMRQLRG